MSWQWVAQAAAAGTVSMATYVHATVPFSESLETAGTVYLTVMAAPCWADYKNMAGRGVGQGPFSGVHQTQSRGPDRGELYGPLLCHMLVLIMTSDFVTWFQ